VSVILWMLWNLSSDLSTATHSRIWQDVAHPIALIGFLAIIFIWLGAMFAAWTGHHLRLPLIGVYAERYSAPPREPFPPSPFSPQ
jgi:hypothetical protein